MSHWVPGTHQGQKVRCQEIPVLEGPGIKLAGYYQSLPNKIFSTFLVSVMFNLGGRFQNCGRNVEANVWAYL